YINFISVANASATLSDRGIATIPIEMNWRPEGEVITVELGDFQKNSQKVFGYAYTADELKPMRKDDGWGELYAILPDDLGEGWYVVTISGEDASGA
ncbi:hypothetical protein NE463_20945, partial [Anaerotruncus colihominis]|nr:hypothetical protein [Anaerotruncus colihominis]